MCVYSLYIELHVYVPVVAVLQSLRLLNCEALEFALDLKTMLHLTAVRVSYIMIVLGLFGLYYHCPPLVYCTRQEHYTWAKPSFYVIDCDKSFSIIYGVFIF